MNNWTVPATDEPTAREAKRYENNRAVPQPASQAETLDLQVVFAKIGKNAASFVDRPIELAEIDWSLVYDDGRHFRMK